MRRRMVLAASMLALPGLARALPAPRLVPSRDVTVSYQVTVPNRPPLEVQVSIAAGGARLRIVGQDLPTSFLVDRQTETAAIVLPMLKTFTRVSIARYDPARTVLREASFIRGGQDRIAGLPCTHWQARSAHGGAQACITEDGVILQGQVISDRKGNEGEVRALRVRVGAVPRQLFVVPADYAESPLGQAAAQFMK